MTAITLPARRRRAGATSRLGSMLGSGGFGLLVGLVLWEIAGRTLQYTFLPPASQVAARLVELVATGQVLPALASSLTNLALGFGIALALGLAVGLGMGGSRRFAAAVNPYVNALLTAPSLVFAPIFFSIWGLGRQSIVALIVTYSTFVIMVNTSGAVRAVAHDLGEMARSFNATPIQAFTWVTLPAATPLILAGVKVAAARAVKGMINGEMFIALVGLGKVIQDAQHQLDATTVIAILAIVVAVSLLLMAVIERIDLRLNGWLPRTERIR
jgi:NitT/TauT family transport system permease protein